MRRGFTLIELLIVVAVIATLAAVLFPVFAQAKEAAKKTTTLVNLRQITSGIGVYSSDADSSLPIATGYYLGQYPQHTLAWPYPAGWIQNWSGGGAHVEDLQTTYWGNAIAPYTRSYQLARCAGLPTKWLFASDSTQIQLKIPEDAGVCMNGLLNTMEATLIDSPSMTPLVWGGLGKGNYKGRLVTNPFLWCPTGVNASCVFDPKESPSGNKSGGAGWVWNPGPEAALYGSCQVVGRADGSASVSKVTPKGGLAANKNILEIWSQYESDPNGRSTGSPFGMRMCVLSDPGAYYPCFFRPDQDGSRSKWSAIYE